MPCPYIFGPNWVVSDGVGFCLRVIAEIRANYLGAVCTQSASSCGHGPPRSQISNCFKWAKILYNGNHVQTSIHSQKPRIRWIEWSLIVPRWFERQPPPRNKELVRCFVTDWFGLYNRLYRAIRADCPTHSGLIICRFLWSEPLKTYHYIGIGLNYDTILDNCLWSPNWVFPIILSALPGIDSGVIMTNQGCIGEEERCWVCYVLIVGLREP